MQIAVRPWTAPEGGSPVTADEERLRLAASFGLTEWEARVYVALLDLGESKASAIADESRVPRSRVYDVLLRLQAKGGVETVPTLPRRFRGVPPETFLGQRMSELRLQAEEIEKTRSAVGLRLGQRAPRALAEDGGLEVLRGRTAIMEATRSLLNGAAKEILECTSAAGVLRRVRWALPIYESKAAAGVDIRLGVRVTRENLAAVRALLPHARVRHLDAADRAVTVLVVDGARSLLVHWHPDDDDLVRGEDTGIATEESAFSELFRATALGPWESGVDAAARCGDLEPAGS